MSKTIQAIPIERLQRHIFIIRDIKVMLSSDLADLYGVEVKVLNQAVKRNKERFPADFVFQLTHDEFSNLKSQIVTSSWGGVRRAFTVCIYRAWHSYALERSQKSTSSSSQYRDYASVH